MTMYRLQGVVVAALMGIGTSACAPLRASPGPEMVPLEIPEPPPHVVTAAEDRTEVPAGSPEPSQASLPPKAPSPTEQAADAPLRGEPQAAQPDGTPSALPTPARLRSGRDVDGEAQVELVRAILDRAVQSLRGITRSRLSQTEQTQYDTAQRFVAEAEAALESGNLVFARFLADKGATLASQLAPQ